MPLTQTQIIQSLAEALNWFEKGLEWGVSPADLGHLTGRIGELYAAMITRGQMALATNQRGYDVVSAEGEHIFVKTVTSSATARFNANTLDQVDRIMVLRINIDEDAGLSVETLLDIPRAHFAEKLRYLPNGSIDFPTRLRKPQVRPVDKQAVGASAVYGPYLIEQLESGTITIKRDGETLTVAKPVLREIAGATGIDPLNGNGRPKNTRQLGDGVIKLLNSGV